MQMRSILPLGIVAGMASALLLAAIQTGSAIAIPLFLLASLPIALAGLAWGSYTAAIGAVAAAVAWALAVGPQAGVEVFVLTTAPMAWITNLLGLSRDPGGKREWYPLGQVLLQAAVIAAGGLIIVGVVSGFDPDQLAAEATIAIQSNIATGQLPLVTASQIETVTRFYVTALPYLAAAGALALMVLNAWLAALLLDSAGRLKRPRTPLWTAGLPRAAAYVLIAAMAATLLSGVAGAAAAAIVGAFGFAYALAGLGVLHAVTLGRDSRALVLFITYVSILFFGISLIIAALVGIVDSFYRLRAPQSPPLSS
jgi:hypothetical protein